MVDDGGTTLLLPMAGGWGIEAGVLFTFAVLRPCCYDSLAKGSTTFNEAVCFEIWKYSTPPLAPVVFRVFFPFLLISFVSQEKSTGDFGLSIVRSPGRLGSEREDRAVMSL